MVDKKKKKIITALRSVLVSTGAHGVENCTRVGAFLLSTPFGFHEWKHGNRAVHIGRIYVERHSLIFDWTVLFPLLGNTREERFDSPSGWAESERRNQVRTSERWRGTEERWENNVLLRARSRAPAFYTSIEYGISTWASLGLHVCVSSRMKCGEREGTGADCC
jgi:hypothetical protein